MLTGFGLVLMVLVLALSLLVLELFIPSGGVLGFLSGVGFLASVIVAFRHDTTIGLVYLVFLAAALPALLVGVVKYWPHTSVGRMMLNVTPGAEAEPTYNPLEDLIGKRGVAKSKMLPSGAIKVDGRTYDAVSSGEAIEPGEPIEVVRVSGNRITVHTVSADNTVSADANSMVADAESLNTPPSPEPASPKPAAEANEIKVVHTEGPTEDPLHRTYDDAIPDPFEDS